MMHPRASGCLFWQRQAAFFRAVGTLNSDRHHTTEDRRKSSEELLLICEDTFCDRAFLAFGELRLGHDLDKPCEGSCLGSCWSRRVGIASPLPSPV